LKKKIKSDINFLTGK